MGNKQQISRNEQILNPQNLLRQLNIKVDDSFDGKENSQNTTRVNTTGHNENNSFESRSKDKSPKIREKRKQVILSENANERDAQIFNARKKYEKKKQQNKIKLAEIRQKIQTYNKIYRVDKEQENADYAKQDNLQEENVIIWGKVINMKKTDDLQQYYKYRYPKQPVSQQNDEYTNWQIYKNQMSKKKFKQLQQEERQLITEEQELKCQYESLLKQRNQLKCESRYQPKSYLDNSKLIQNQLKGDDNDSDFEQGQYELKMITPSFKHSQKLTYIEETPLNKKKQKEPKTAASINQNTSTSSPKENHPETNIWKHPQNIISSDPQYLAQQVVYYNTYMKNKRPNYVLQQQVPLSQQYPSKRQILKPDRNKQTIVDPYLHKLQKSRKRKNKRMKSKSKSKSKIDESLYTKVYEKIPKKKYTSPEDRFKAVLNFYPWQDHKKSKYMNSYNYPSTIKVNDSLHQRQNDEGTLYFHMISRDDDGNKQWLNRINSNQIYDEDSEENYRRVQKRKRMRNQRQIQSQILEKVRFKNL